jgi:hypothetical protein
VANLIEAIDEAAWWGEDAQVLLRGAKVDADELASLGDINRDGELVLHTYLRAHRFMADGILNWFTQTNGDEAEPWADPEVFRNDPTAAMLALAIRWRPGVRGWQVEALRRELLFERESLQPSQANLTEDFMPFEERNAELLTGQVEVLLAAEKVAVRQVRLLSEWVTADQFVAAAGHTDRRVRAWAAECGPAQVTEVLAEDPDLQVRSLARRRLLDLWVQP